MPAVQVRDLPQETYDKLTFEAKACGRSINKQLRTIVESHFAERSAAGSDRVANADFSVAAAAPVDGGHNAMAYAQAEARGRKREALFAKIDGCSFPEVPNELDSARLVREMRDER